MGLPSLTDIEAAAGVFFSSGKAGSVGAGAAAVSAASTLQTDVLDAVSKAGSFLGPILGSSGIAAFQQGATPAAASAAQTVQNKYLGGFSIAQIGGAVAIGALAVYLLLKRK